MNAGNLHRSAGSIEVSIAAHFVPARIDFLAKVLSAIARWDEREVRITLDTNDAAITAQPAIKRAAALLAARRFELGAAIAKGMAHPFHLTWQHKHRLREWFNNPARTHADLFIYIEDDIVIRADNIHYVHAFLPVAKQARVLPGFLRYEIDRDGAAISPDARGYQTIRHAQSCKLNGQNFIAPEFSYWAGFVLDPELCSEYLRSPWSSLAEAPKMPQSRNHSCRVQSAWGLTHVNVPRGLPSRYVVPIDEQGAPLTACLVHHAANNYVISHQHNFGTVAIDQLFQPSALSALSRNLVWQTGALRRRMAAKLMRIRGAFAPRTKLHESNRASI